MAATRHDDSAGDSDDDGSRGDRLGRSSWALAALVVARVAALAYVLLSHQERVDGGIAGDVHRYLEMTTAQGVPYRDFQVEYPPVTYALIKLLSGADLARSIAGVAVSQFVCDLGIAALLRWAWGHRACIAYLLLGVPLMAYPFVYARVDLFTVLLAVGALALVRRGRDIAGGIGLAVAVLAKLWPIALAPVLLVERQAVGRDEDGGGAGRPRLSGIIALVATGFVGAVAWAGFAGLSGFQQVLSFREATGWQVESVPGILWHLHDPSRIKFESGAFRTGVMPPWGRPALTLVSLLLVAAAWWLAARRRRAGAGDDVSFADAPLAAVLAVLLFAPILSPQYIVWVLPFAALVAAGGDRVVAALTAAITALTTVTYVLVLDAADGDLHATLPVLLRNVLLVALLVAAFQRLAGVRVPHGDDLGDRTVTAPAAVTGQPA
jgi:hypothetical protein